MASRPQYIETFALQPGRRIGGKYIVEDFLGGGWEGEVYRVTEASTKVTRAAKLFYPDRNIGNKAVQRYARRLERLRDCPSIIQYHHSETIRFKGNVVTCLLSEFVEGRILEHFINDQPGRRLHPTEALHLLHALTTATECVHQAREYHGDLHEGNVLVSRRGIHFDIHLVDYYPLECSTTAAQREDIVDLVKLLHLMIGGPKHYLTMPAHVKAICKGLRRDLILKQFPTATRLRRHLERFEWE